VDNTLRKTVSASANEAQDIADWDLPVMKVFQSKTEKQFDVI
jgi:hypothetical protein